MLLFLISFTDFYFIHYSDPQIGRNIYAYPYCTLAVHQLSQLQPQPAFILIAGDMADDPTNPTIVMSQWQTCDSIFDLLSIPKYYSPGNNDLGYANESCWTPAQLALYRNFWGPDYYSIDYDSCHIICLNSTLLDTYSGHACYTYSLEQDSFFRNDLASITPEQYRHIFLFFHFPLYLSSPTEPNSNNNVDRPRRDTILTNLIKYNATAVFTGHLHYDLMNWYGKSLLQSGIATCEVNIANCGYRPVKVFRNGIETYTVFLNAPVDSVPVVQIVTASVSPETVQTGVPVNFNCVVDSIRFPDWRGLTYRWQFGDGQFSSAPNTTHPYADTGKYRVVFSAYKSPRLAALYYFYVIVNAGQKIVESVDSKVNLPILRVISSIVKDNLYFELSHSSEVKIEIYQVDARLVMTHNTGSISKGRHCLKLTPSLSDGIYFCRFKIRNQYLSTKLIVVRK